MYGNDNAEELSHWDDITCDTQLPYICQVKVTFNPQVQIKSGANPK